MVKAGGQWTDHSKAKGKFLLLIQTLIQRPRNLGVRIGKSSVVGLGVISLFFFVRFSAVSTSKNQHKILYMIYSIHLWFTSTELKQKKKKREVPGTQKHLSGKTVSGHETQAHRAAWEGWQGGHAGLGCLCLQMNPWTFTMFYCVFLSYLH